MQDYPDWMKVIAIVGRDPVTGEPVIVQLDALGRLSAFIVDTSDVWGRLLSIGNAELAARLGSIHLFDRRGNVVCMDSFEYGLMSWHPTISDPDCSVKISSLVAAHGPYSVEMDVSDVALNSAQIVRYFPVPPTTRIGLQASLTLSTYPSRLMLSLALYDGSKLHHAAVYHDPGVKKLYYQHGDDAWTKIADVPVPYVSAHYFSTMKMVFDLATGKYVRVILNRDEYDGTTWSYYSIDDNTAPHMEVKLYIQSTIDDHTPVYFDDVIVTNAEPE